MRIQVLMIVLTFSGFICKSQSVIENGSFEKQSKCPIFGEITDANNWYSASALPPKLLDSCVNLNNPFFGVPQNSDSLLGFQIPLSGHAYVFMNVYLESNPNLREYLKYLFKKPLKKDKNYCLEFYVNLFNRSRLAIDAIGAHFTDSNLFCSSIPCLLNNTPQISNPQGKIISDTLGWTKISGCFTAKGNEKYMIIGNFLPDSLVQKDTNRYVSTWDWGSSYYIDDVSLYFESDTLSNIDTSNLSFPNVFSPNNDGVNELFVAEAYNINSLECKIYNRFGGQVYEFHDINASWDGRSSSGTSLPEGVYYYQAYAIGYDKKVFNLKGFVSLIR